LPALHVLPDGISIKVGEEDTRDVLELLTGSGILLESECGGEGSCGKCLVELTSGDLVDKTGAPAVPVYGRMYLACQSYPSTDCSVSVGGPAAGGDEFDAFIAGSIGPMPGRAGSARRLGLAVDIGTTTVVALLADLASGAPLAVESETNPQRAYGADVITRIAFSTDRRAARDGTAVLHEAIAACINRLIALLCDGSGASPRSIESVVCVGNTAMQHFLLGVTPARLGVAPYRAEFKEVEPRPAADVGLELSGEATLEVLPNIGSFIGADAVGCLLAVERERGPACSIMVDMGTNTEMALDDGRRRVACSAAAGPAFEGAHLAHGMRATPGAIKRARVSDGGLTFETVGGEPAEGICGSGIVDVIAALRRLGEIDARGRMPGQAEYVVVEAARSGTGRDITVTRHDVREIQLVKASIATGLTFLLERYGLGFEQVEKFYVAGAFGNYLDLANARFIGLLPDLPPDRFEPVGDAALKGAYICLTGGAPALERARRIAFETEHLELAGRPEFQKRFIESLRLERYGGEEG
jgi:uncharacterized 2Fe-2S/4Fe-4S cluster protein (DUF4445 family)